MGHSSHSSRPGEGAAAQTGGHGPRSWVALGRALVLALLCMTGSGLLGCTSTQPDKRVLQHLVQKGFGQRYTGNAEEQNYVTLGDTILINDAFNPELQGRAETVDIDGTIILPEIGAVVVAGKTRSELEAFLTQKYSPYFTDLDLEVRIGSSTGKVYYIFGEVSGKGVQSFTGDLTVFQAVMAASPNPQTANLARTRLIRADPRDPLVVSIPVGDMLSTGDSTYNMLIQERDIIYVPPTMLAQFGYFLSDLIFPVTQVFQQLGGALFFIGNNGFNRGIGNNNGF